MAGSGVTSHLSTRQVMLARREFANPVPSFADGEEAGYAFGEALSGGSSTVIARSLATKQSIVRRTRLWIASLTGRRLAPSRWLAMTTDGSAPTRPTSREMQGAARPIRKLT